MQHLNYCRQLTEYGVENIVSVSGFHERWDELFGESFAETLNSSTKFALPKNGLIIDDDEYRGLLSTGILGIPFEKLALEYEFESLSAKVILFLRWHFETLSVNVSPLFYDSTSPGRWIAMPTFCVFSRDHAHRTILWQPTRGAEIIINEHGDGEFFYDNFLSSTCNFLNALACRNVHIEKSPAKSTKQGKKVKTALPFDDYHFLTVDVPGKAGTRSDGLGGSHRSPREHLRRGHIRRLDSGPVWVNACVVNAGIGGKVGKSYLLRKSE